MIALSVLVGSPLPAVLPRGSYSFGFCSCGHMWSHAVSETCTWSRILPWPKKAMSMWAISSARGLLLKIEHA